MGSEMKDSLLTQIEKLEQKIKTTDISAEARTVKEWGGADVIIKERLDRDVKNWLGNQPLVISLQNTEPRRRAVITNCAKELSWLFYQLKGIFFERIDYISKYDFYGLLAQSAIDHITKSKETQDAKPLLLAVLNTAKGFCEDEPPA
ncbi:conserved hypothetical protein [Candidatus Brocadia pituitae]|nr:conserved hypothetical protein [Candidatus Brocadia pituitae]